MVKRKKKNTSTVSTNIVETKDPISVVKGSHLTVTTFSDGRTELVWDDDALLRDVQKAIADYEASQVAEEVKPKKTRKKKVVE